MHFYNSIDKIIWTVLKAKMKIRWQWLLVRQPLFSLCGDIENLNLSWDIKSLNFEISRVRILSLYMEFLFENSNHFTIYEDIEGLNLEILPLHGDIKEILISREYRGFESCRGKRISRKYWYRGFESCQGKVNVEGLNLVGGNNGHVPKDLYWNLATLQS